MDADLLWQPSPARAERTQMHAFLVKMAAAYGFRPDWPSLHHWSVADRDSFWREMLAWAAVQTTAPVGETSEGQGMLGTRWFPGVELNFAQHLLRHNDGRIAIEAEDELGRIRSISYRELRTEVARCAAAMRAMGVARGDRVAGFLPNIPEAVIAMLASASLGAVWSSCSPDFGASGVLDRFGQIAPKLFFAADGYSYNGKVIDSLERVRAIVAQIHSIERVVVVRFVDPSADIAHVPSAVPWSEFLAAGCEPTFASLPFDHPLYIMYSSGTTGVPKCIVHGAGGTLLEHMKELLLHCDLAREDVVFYFTTLGWMMWNWLVSALGVGATLVLYEGSPSYPKSDRLWRLCERHGITVFGTSAKYLAACEKAGLEPGASRGLSKLRAVLSTGSPLSVESFRWTYAHVKRDLQLASISGGTDILGCFMLGNPQLPVYAGEIQCLGLGMDVHAYDANGDSVIGERGELVCRQPFPSQPLGFWNDPAGSSYREAYFDHYPDVWRHGDFVTITERGGVVVHGRSDATLNPGGVRIGTAEIYRVVESVPEVLDSVVVGKSTTDADVEICLFVVLREGVTLDDALAARLRQRIRESTTARHMPKHIKQVTAVPYTLSGKKVELAVAQVIAGEPVPNRDALANPEALAEYAGIV